MPLTFEQFAERVAAQFSLQADAGILAWDTGLFDELGLDSLQAFMLILLVESLAEVEVPPVEIPPMFVLGDAFTYYEDLRR